jgi:hypothetical protein
LASSTWCSIASVHQVSAKQREVYHRSTHGGGRLPGRSGVRSAIGETIVRATSRSMIGQRPGQFRRSAILPGQTTAVRTSDLIEGARVSGRKASNTHGAYEYVGGRCVERGCGPLQNAEFENPTSITRPPADPRHLGSAFGTVDFFAPGRDPIVRDLPTGPGARIHAKISVAEPPAGIAVRHGSPFHCRADLAAAGPISHLTTHCRRTAGVEGSR